MDLDQIKDAVVAFVVAHQAYAPLIVGILAFCESLAFLSLLVPATVLLVAIGVLIGATGLEFWPIWLGATVGAFLGDTISYFLGRYFQNGALTVWPLSKNPGMIERGRAFFGKWGAWGVFIGRFFGPLRAVVPLIAGVFAMPVFLFQMANASSAMVWAFAMLAPGAGLLQALK
ncbi:DedA family protein [Salinarimonas soli]|uniref:DedA family protein n=1 Tax=Salinarimonas soli TaxID=1638099 RepID=A0A5B2V811_9HYPH|nr:DedA family protein [Salinarimonas soli]KAA2235174.1 DedA family protein [Salinarimonas soli]